MHERQNQQKELGKEVKTRRKYRKNEKIKEIIKEMKSPRKNRKNEKIKEIIKEMIKEKRRQIGIWKSNRKKERKKAENPCVSMNSSSKISDILIYDRACKAKKIFTLNGTIKI